MSKPLSIIPIGGLEEIGMNMTVFRYLDDIIVVDTGLMFPEEDMLGIDYVIPDLTYLKDNADKIKAIIITHGHEDHTGALPFVLKEIGLDIPVYATPLTIGIIKGKLREHEITKTDLNPIKPRDIVEIGAFKVEFIRVTHSIVDGVGLGIQTPIGNIVHTADFKLDPTPVDGELMDFHKFTEYGEKGTLILLSDSTNAEKGGFTYSEKEVRRAFENIFSSTDGRLIIATFASNIHRIQQAIDVSVKYGRKVILCGKSLVTNAQIALDLGYLKIPEETWLSLERLKTLDDDKVTILTTGSQGEPMSVLSRIAIDEHKHIKIKENDTVILSAKMIPGNERSIGRIINHLFSRGADVIYEKVSEVHVSGHASKEELKLMINMVKPKYFIPIHGEYRHLVYHSKLASKSGIPAENIFIMENGDVLQVGEGSAEINGKVTSGRIFIDGKSLGDVADMVLRDRWRLAQDGIIIILLSVEKLSGRIINEPDIITRGFVVDSSSDFINKDLKDFIANTIGDMEPEIVKDASVLKEKVRSLAKKKIKQTFKQRPMIIPIIMEV
ncbi:MAG: ribonuclease J [Nitrospirota bacterium]|nr:MAG: ribonuclease J [Nitrospirota bacterium]